MPAAAAAPRNLSVPDAKLIPPADLRLETALFPLAALAWGEESAIPVLALHGWLDNAASFANLGPLLAGVRLVALDLPGHGHSPHRPPGIAYHFVDSVADVMAAADALGWERFSLLGHSLGASIAAFTAAACPGRVRRLALIEGLGPWSGEPERAPAQLAEATGQLLTRARTRPPSYASLEEAARARQGAGDLGWEAALALARRGTRVTRSGRVTWRSDPRLTFRSPLYLTEDQVRAFLAAIPCPALLIRGAQGLDSPRAHLAERQAVVRDLRVEILPGGHHLHMDRPRAVAEVVGEFLAAAPD